jgi:hypothetical protein
MTVATSPTGPQTLAARDLGPAPEPEIIRDIAKRCAYAAPVALVAGFLGWQLDGLVSVAVALVVVVANFALAASLQAWAARISLGLVMGVALFGFVVRLAIVSAIVWSIGQQPWVEPMPLGLTLIIGHLGLLIWETRFVSASLAFPGLKPAPVKEKP